MKLFGKMLFSAGRQATLYCSNLYSDSGRKTAVENRKYVAAQRGDAHPKGLRARRREQRRARLKRAFRRGEPRLARS